MKRRAFLVLPFAASAAHAHSAHLGDIKIGHPWALPAESAVGGQVFMPLLNTGKTDDSLIAARSPVAAFVELRTNNRYDDPAAKEFLLPPGKPLAMRPTALHLRLVGLRQALKPGDKFSIILDFLSAGEIELTVFIETTPGI
jgi:periplasmic copper chaperone A